MAFPVALEHLIESFCELPGVGRKTAERFVFHLLKKNPEVLKKFATNLNSLSENRFICPECYNYSEGRGLCPICLNDKRDKKIICVVEDINDLAVLEKTRIYNGLYHVLNGRLDPLEGILAENLNIHSLIDRIKKNQSTEIILALNPDIQGEATILFLKQLLKSFNIKISLLARGLPMNSDLEYADDATLSNAIKGRQEVK